MIDQVTSEVWLWRWCLLIHNKSQYIGSPLWTSPDTCLFIRRGPVPDSRSKWLTAELHGSSSRDFWETRSGRNSGPHPRNLLPRVSYDRPTKSTCIQGEYKLHRWGDSHPSVHPSGICAAHIFLLWNVLVSDSACVQTVSALLGWSELF